MPDSKKKKRNDRSLLEFRNSFIRVTQFLLLKIKMKTFSCKFHLKNHIDKIMDKNYSKFVGKTCIQGRLKENISTDKRWVMV